MRFDGEGHTWLICLGRMCRSEAFDWGVDVDVGLDRGGLLIRLRRAVELRAAIAEHYTDFTISFGSHG